MATKLEELQEVLNIPVRPSLEILSNDSEPERADPQEEPPLKKPKADGKPFATVSIALFDNKVQVKIDGKWTKVTRRVVGNLPVHINRAVDEHRRAEIIERRKANGAVE